jgi:hypothetical protein
VGIPGLRIGKRPIGWLVLVAMLVIMGLMLIVLASAASAGMVHCTTRFEGVSTISGKGIWQKGTIGNLLGRRDVGGLR